VPDTGVRGRTAVLRRIEQLFASRGGSPRVRRLLLIIALIVFVVVSVISFRSLPDGVHFHWWALPIVLAVTTPLTVLANAAEFRVMGAINGHSVRWLAAVRLTVIAGAANLLPLPGGIVIRTQALRQRGSSYKHALAANVVAGIAWIGTGALAIAVLLAFRPSSRLAALVLTVVGIACLVGVLVILHRMDRTSAARFLWRFVLVEAATVIVSGARLFFVFRLIGLAASAAQAVALTASQIIAAAVGIFPAGLGLREILAAGIGSAVDLPAGEAVAVTASDRIAVQITLAVFAALLLLPFRRDVTHDVEQAAVAVTEETSADDAG
jgi:hypothetical protein